MPPLGITAAVRAHVNYTHSWHFFQKVSFMQGPSLGTLIDSFEPDLGRQKIRTGTRLEKPITVCYSSFEEPEVSR
jgi:hypothetical protein